jgi:hypothetical protein
MNGIVTWETQTMQTTEQVLATGIRTTPQALIIILSAGEASIPWEQCSQRLAKATSEQRQVAELSPSGYGIHWPLIDEDLTVDRLVQKSGLIAIGKV